MSTEHDTIDATRHHVGDTLGLATIKDAAQADEVEHKQTLAEAFAVHQQAIFWSMALSGALIMEGYDVVVIGSFYGHRKYKVGVLAKGSELLAPLRGGSARHDQRLCHSGTMAVGPVERVVGGGYHRALGEWSRGVLS